MRRRVPTSPSLFDLSTFSGSDSLVHDRDLTGWHVVCTVEVYQRTLAAKNLWMVRQSSAVLVELLNELPRHLNVMVNEHCDGVRTNILKAGVKEHTHGVNDEEILGLACHRSDGVVGVSCQSRDQGVEDTKECKMHLSRINPWIGTMHRVEIITNVSHQDCSSREHGQGLACTNSSQLPAPFRILSVIDGCCPGLKNCKDFLVGQIPADICLGINLT